MTDKRESEQRITDELANEPKSEQDPEATERAKQRRADAEKELNDSKNRGG